MLGGSTNEKNEKVTINYCCITDGFLYDHSSISKSKIILLTGQTIQLKVSETSGGTTWISSKKSVATVNKSGKVLAKKKGSAIITAKAGNKKYTCKVTVETPKLNKKMLH